MGVLKSVTISLLRAKDVPLSGEFLHRSYRFGDTLKITVNLFQGCHTNHFRAPAACVSVTAGVQRNRKKCRSDRHSSV